jgi:ElaB/YqjD/DUF883 family membrane-anchored ribosome-binding protein
MDNAQREIRNEIEATRQDMVEKIATLEDRVDSTIQGVKRSFDPQYQTQQHPWLMVGLSVAAGYLFSGLVLGRPTPRAKLVLPDDWDTRVPVKQRNTGMLQSLTGMLSGVVTATAVSLARDFASRTLFKSQPNGHGNGEEPSGTKSSGQRSVTYPH